MAFVTLYRKYRPANFNDIVGQKYIIQTLRNAIKYDRIGHAYLFAGPRGTGKTSTAKVFARALNCQDDSSIEPCGECEPCQKIENGRSIDVVEIDAASNRGVDEIRELREKIKFYPGEGGYKVYIIDEVHMLTKEAFNALLKTLEEPPPSVVFVLATTEPFKVISTIHSRCQRFDFSLLSLSDIQQRLQFICEKEDVEYQKQALNIIADSSNGGLRDAISILDQAISYTGASIKVELLTSMLGKVEQSTLNDFITLLSKKETAQTLQILNDIMDKGKGVARFVTDLISHCRNLLLIKECGINSGLLDFTKDTLQQMEKKAEDFSQQKLLEIIAVLTDVEQKIKYSNQPRLALEMAFIEITSQSQKNDSVYQQLLERVSRLEEGLKSDGQPAWQETENTDKKIKRTEKEKTNKIDTKRTEFKKANKKNNKETDREEAAEKTTVNNQGSQENLNLDLIKQQWAEFLSMVNNENIRAGAFLREGQPVQVKENTVFIAFSEKNRFHKKGAEDNKDLIARLCSKMFNSPCQISFFIKGEKKDESIQVKKKQEKKEVKGENELVKKVAEMFDGVIIKVDSNKINS